MAKTHLGRGAQMNTKNPFDKFHCEPIIELETYQKQTKQNIKTEFIKVFPKTIINKNNSPDIPYNYSMNPYQGCEHGCVYCYARNTHPYWGYSAGIDFESKILVKTNAIKLLRKTLERKSWITAPIMLSGNTDCYQPAERIYKITRGLLKLLLEKRHPVSIITKNNLILRDIDILKSLASHGLVHVVISLTSLNPQTCSNMEPRASTGSNRLKLIKALSEAKIPVHVLLAPIIPMINSHEVYELTKQVGLAGAISASPIMVRLNGDLKEIFEDWLQKIYPDRANKVLRYIAELHEGNLGESRFGHRMKGSGNLRNSILDQHKLASAKYFDPNIKMPEFNLDLHPVYKNGQLKLF